MSQAFQKQTVATGVTVVNSMESFYAKGVKAYRTGDHQTAATYFRRALVQNASSVNAHYYLGLALDRLGQGQMAVSDYAFVVDHGQEPEIVAYAQRRLQALGFATPVAAMAGESNGLSGSNMALMASGLPSTALVNRNMPKQVAVPLKSTKNALMVDALLSQGNRQVEGAFIIDTGATYTSISQEMAERLGLDLEGSEKVYITTANGRIQVPKVLIQSLNVNGLQATNVEATVIPVRAGSSFSGLLGLSFICQFVLTIDPQSNHLIFRRN